LKRIIINRLNTCSDLKNVNVTMINTQRSLIFQCQNPPVDGAGGFGPTNIYSLQTLFTDSGASYHSI